MNTAETQTACCTDDCCTDTAVLSAPTDAEIRAVVREKYGQIATSGGSCCGTTGCGCGSDLSMIGDAYDTVEGYVADADLGLGCGLPTEHAALQPGETVLDLGSGAGLDAFVARRIIGERGRVFGVDMTPAMIARARENAATLGYANVHFLEGEIEALPLPDGGIDVILSNCVLNLVPDKARAFAEMHRVLRPGGRFCVSDIVTLGDLPADVQRSMELYVGCVAGAMDRDAYLDLLRAAGFTNVEVATARVIDVPDEALADVLSPNEIAAYRATGSVIESVTVTGRKG